MNKKENLLGFLFLLPNFLGFFCFLLIPVLLSLGMAFTDWDLLSPPNFIGFQNFVELLKDNRFWKYLGNTFFLMISIPFNIMGSLILASLLAKNVRFSKIFRLVFYLPTICTGVATCMVWIWLYNPNYGLINLFLSYLGVEGPGWLTDVSWSKPALMVMGFWAMIGGQNMILYIAGLQGIPQSLYEAADIDGASFLQKFWHITIPMLAPTTFFIVIMSIIGGFQGGFESAYIMTGGGPDGSTTTLSYYIYNNAYSWFRMGYAAATSWILFLIIFLFTLIKWKISKKIEGED